MNNFNLNQSTTTGNPYPIPEKGTAREKTEISFEYIKDLHVRAEKIEQSLGEIQKKNADQNNRNIEILAVFVTLFTFISVETQILRAGISFLTAVGFSILFLGGLSFFLFTLRFVIKDERTKFWQYLSLLLFSLIVVGIGIFLVWLGENTFYNDLNDKYYSKVQVNQMFASSSNQSLLDFKKCIQVNGAYWPCLK